MYFYLLLFHRFQTLENVFTHAVGNQISNREYLLDLIQGRSKVHQWKVSRESGLNFDQ